MSEINISEIKIPEDLMPKNPCQKWGHNFINIIETEKSDFQAL